MRNLLLVLVVLAACSSPDARSTDTTAGRSSGALRATRRDSAPSRHQKADTVAVIGPTLLSAFVTTQAEVDSAGDVGEALSDYQYYLGQAIPGLERHGVRVHLTNDSIVHWRDRSGTHSLTVADSGGIAYLFLLPDGSATILRQGVIGDLDIIAAASERFGFKLTAQDTVRKK
jgi:hypothetical protein